MKIVEKIKALLAKARSTDHEAEAEAFFAKAYELMTNYQLDIGDLFTGDPMGQDDVYFRANRGGVDWDSRLMFAVARYFGCKAIQECNKSNYWVTLVGRVSARVTAVEMHKYLVTTVRRLGREGAAEMGVKPDIAARRIGVALQSRLNALAKEQSEAEAPGTKFAKNALVTTDELRNWVEKHHPNLHSIKGRSSTNAMARDIAGGIGLHLQAGSSKVAGRLT